MILRMRDATYVSRGNIVAPPTSFDIDAGERVAHHAANPLEAEAVAMLAAALVRPSGGTVLIGEYDPRVQPVHCKRLAGFVPHDPLPLREMGFDRFIDYRAALWDIDREHARDEAERILAELRSLHEAFAFPIVGALIAAPRLLVLDRPQPSTREAIYAVAGATAILETLVG